MQNSSTALADALGILGIGEHIAACGCALIESLLGQPLEVSGAMVADEIYAWQLRQRLAVASRAARLLKEQDLAPRLLRKGFLLPFLDAAGNVDDPELQPLWARLLVSAVSCDYLQHPMLIETLRRMSREDVEVLRELAEPPARSRVATFDRPADQPQSQRELAYARLHSLGLLAPWVDPRAQQPLPGQGADPACKVEEELLGISRFGWQFVVAVIPEAAAPMFRFDPYSCP
ncbi:MAG: hypothetical protein JWO87_3018 [Phycisphaerales bacterium]|jgi:hypothetical protein|nr:hypothetical protein [Phycisphaerales bacterium]MDB5301355.1 hypothetical protein [Phycisphaerales bacterium]MDB5303325.1 hypothetical protein [Phycisphaerales bacterium]